MPFSIAASLKLWKLRVTPARLVLVVLKLTSVGEDDPLSPRARRHRGLYAAADAVVGPSPEMERRYRELLNGCEGGPSELLHSAVEVWGKRDQLISFAGQQKSEPKCDSARCQ